MQIAATFNDLDEMLVFCRRMVAEHDKETPTAPKCECKKEKPKKEPAVRPENSPEPPFPMEMKEQSPKEEKPENEAPVKDIEALKVKARGLLAEANKKAGKRLSQEWTEELAGTGAKLKDIADIETVEELIKRAEEVLK